MGRSVGVAKVRPIDELEAEAKEGFRDAVCLDCTHGFTAGIDGTCFIAGVDGYFYDPVSGNLKPFPEQCTMRNEYGKCEHFNEKHKPDRK